MGNLATRTDFNNHLEFNHREFDKIRPTGRDENTAIRHEIAATLQPSQEMLMDKLEKTGANCPTNPTTSPAASSPT